MAPGRIIADLFILNFEIIQHSLHPIIETCINTSIAVSASKWTGLAMPRERLAAICPTPAPSQIKQAPKSSRASNAMRKIWIIETSIDNDDDQRPHIV
jgi:hypothetical protein